MAFPDSARFYSINGKRFPSVTTILSVINKPALGPWYAKEERRVFEAALLNVLTTPGDHGPDHILDELTKAVSGIKAGDRAKTQAGTIGTAAHAMIEWRTRRLLGQKVGPEPVIPEAAQWAVMAWEDWAKEVDLIPLHSEHTVSHSVYGYAGTIDLIAKVRGVVTVCDYKTGKAIYPESFLQNAAYRAAARTEGIESDQGVILRLPKTMEDPAFEAMLVPETPIEDFLAAFRLWRWQRRMEGKPVGERPSARRGAN